VTCEGNLEMVVQVREFEEIEAELIRDRIKYALDRALKSINFNAILEY
jgi:hypothetical protein